MAEIKNNFLGSRMNLDIDDRLLPSNEYRYALNLQINRSENSDVGTLQNVLGNVLKKDFNSITGTTGLECIGAYPDNSRDNIYIFLTNNNETEYNKDANNFIFVYNSIENSSTELVSGAYLNFSTQNPVLGINLIEELLFWTDNRNQPRRININQAFGDVNYYKYEEQISVAKISPLYSPQLYKLTSFTDSILLSSSATVSITTGSAPYNVLITPSTPFSRYTSRLFTGATVSAIPGNPSSFTTGVVSQITTSGANITSFRVASTTAITAGSVTDLRNTSIGAYETTMYDVVSEKLPDNTTDNPYYNPYYIGDTTYLEDKFIRFSYRYRFEDGEYSIMAPFTQIAYIPRQDGYFMYDGPVEVDGEPIRDDEVSAYRSTVVKFMRNKVNNILLQIQLPCEANLLTSRYKISYIEILYKDANELAVSVVDLISVDPNIGGPFSTTDTVYSYNYVSKKPFKVLPERDLIRVNDVVPVKALGQEIVGNRVIYSNYQDKHGYPRYLNYNLYVSSKGPFGFYDGAGTSLIEYPNHSLKQNRNYQVGIILCDRFGRESSVILSNVVQDPASTSTSLTGDSSYFPYAGGSGRNPGYVLNVTFNELIQPQEPNQSTGWPGLYNGDDTSDSYNPLGWYSYKIVVKQTEQDYYNVYLPGTMAAYPMNQTLELGKTSHFVLLNDNINKVPRDLTEVGPDQKQYRSSVVLYARVDNTNDTYNNQQYDPGKSFSVVSTIATSDSLFYANGLPTGGLPYNFNNFYQIDSNPLIARLSTPEQIGVPTVDNSLELINVIYLSVFETKPIESKLDIYWETSSSGLISDLNNTMLDGASFNVRSLEGWSLNTLFESTAPETLVGNSFRFEDVNGNTISPTSVDLLSVQTNAGTSVLDSFEIVPFEPIPNTFKIKTRPNKYFYYGYDSSYRSYTFTIRANVVGAYGTFIKTGSLKNVVPSIDSHPATITKTTGTLTVYDFSGKNGSNVSGGNSTIDLTWSVTGSSEFTINSSTGLLTTNDSGLLGTYNLVIKVTDAGGLFATSNVTVIYQS
jgi:hypothetical protein